MGEILREDCERCDHIVPGENNKAKVYPSFKTAYCNDQDYNLVPKKRRAWDILST
jgi:hypothetical protein